MSQIIAGLYEIEKKIGSGGGGVVYLGKHLRLEKPVVLKADKRELNVGADTLRREVDMLKGLRQTYIPQVYDFVQQDGVVYTVMDYIEGESLDKILKRGQKPGQPDVIKWACQLLEALKYLHGQPPYGILHGDIKPANIMLKPDGDICLIDYNIALALGESGAVRVGYSRGYASPEHYGSAGPMISDGSERTETMTDVGIRSGSGRSSTVSYHPVLLDVRSDIYSLGATLYHLLSGRRPAQDAEEVEPLGQGDCSPAVAAIIRKAMDPEPAARYQSAEEMLKAFLELHRKDPRAVRHRVHMAAAGSVLGVLFLLGGASAFIGLKQLEGMQSALALAEYSANVLAQGSVSEAVSLAMQAIPQGESILEPPVTAQAQKALTDALGVYDLSAGFHDLDTVELPAEPFDVWLSPEGTRIAAVYAYEAAVYDAESLDRIAALPVRESALSDVCFLDENRIVYAGTEGVTAYDLVTEKVLWTGEPAVTLAVSGDGGTVAAVDRTEDHASIYRVSDGTCILECSFQGQYMGKAVNDIFADPENDVFALNEDGSMLAVSFSGGCLRIYDLKSPQKDLTVFEESDYLSMEGGFCGKYFAYTASGGNGAEFGMIDTEEGVYAGVYEALGSMSLQVYEEGICLASGGLLIRIDPDTLEETELAYLEGQKITGFSADGGYTLTATDMPGFAFYDSGARRMSEEYTEENCDFVFLRGEYAVLANRNESVVRVLRLEDHDETRLLSYDTSYEHDEARISQDGKTAMLFDYHGFRIYDMGGAVLAEAELPNPESIYDQQFRKGEDGSWLEVIWYDGTVRRYSAADGKLVSEKQGTPPDESLYEEFYTDRYRIESELHESPKVYDRETGEKITSLEDESYLTYVTQINKYIITEYVSAAGDRYGLLLDENLQTLAYLPGLCDIAGETLIFDDGSGNLRQCRLYSLQELLDLGELYLENTDGKESLQK